MYALLTCVVTPLKVNLLMKRRMIQSLDDLIGLNHRLLSILGGKLFELSEYFAIGEGVADVG